MKWLFILLMLYATPAGAADWYMIGLTVGCESGGRAEVWGDDHKSFGIAQFQWETFKRMRDKAHMPQLRWKSPEDQLTLMNWAFDNGLAGQWTCWRRHHKKWEQDRSWWFYKHRNNLLHD